MSLLRLLCEDHHFTSVLSKYLKPQFFDSEVLGWIYESIMRHRDQYGTTPTVRVVLEQTRSLEASVRPLYTAVVERVMVADLRDEEWLRNKVMDFIKRNIFVAAYSEVRTKFNRGDTDEAYDFMMGQMDEVQSVRWAVVDQEWLAEEVGDRQSMRLGMEAGADCVPTGFPWLDKILDGGLSLGELGIWIADAKGGKSTMLINLGKSAARVGWKNVWHGVFEGSRQQVAARYDASFSEELYRHVKTGDIDSKRYSALYNEMQILRGKMVVRGFTEEWNYSVADIHSALRELKQVNNWVPDLVIIDYGDLLNGRESHYASETAKQRSAFRDMKTLANKGYAVWTASQAQRPKEGDDDKPFLLKARQIADCYDKVRVADFLGSLNQTNAERDAKVMRLFAELYRDNEANQMTVVRADFSRALIKAESGLASPSVIAAMSEDPLLHRPKQMAAPL